MYQIVDALISRKADVRATDMMGRTALHHAAKYGEIKACMWALRPDLMVGKCCQKILILGKISRKTFCHASYGRKSSRKIFEDFPIREMLPGFGKCWPKILRFCQLGKCSRNAAQPRTVQMHLSSPASCLSHTHTGTSFIFLTLHYSSRAMLLCKWWRKSNIPM